MAACLGWRHSWELDITYTNIVLFLCTRDKEGNPLTPRGENGKPKLNEE